jgi:hypothetical protein
VKIAISGSRTFEDRQLVGGVVDELREKGHFILVGDVPAGVDLFVREYIRSDEAELELDEGALHKVFVADWEANGKAAGHMRNAQMLAEAEGFIAIFATGKRTPGTSSALTIAERMGLPRRVYHEARWTKFPGNAERTPPLREGSQSESRPPDYWFCTGCGLESVNGPDPDRLLIDPRFGRKSCRDCKKYTIWKVLRPLVAAT